MSTVNLKSIRKRKVVDTENAKTVGRVKGVQIDPAGPRVTAVVVRGDHPGLVPHSTVIAFGPDAVTLPRTSVVVENSESLPTDDDAYGNRLLDDSGRELGEVEDLTMDADGKIISITAGGETYERKLLGIGSYAVVVSRS